VSGFDKLVVFVAKGFGTGCVPKAPGTVGSVAGVAWVAILLLPGDRNLYLTATVLGVFASVWFCGRAEEILQLHDPGSIVIDEIVALPICFLPLVLRDGGLSDVQTVFVENWWWAPLVFGLFRLFDIWKPWPVNQIQNLPGGWGVTADDVLAGSYVCAIVWFLP
jgi:phosphatidylglycerophosphatase A